MSPMTPDMNWKREAQELAVNQAVLHPLLFSLSAQPVFGDLLQLSQAFAEHLEGGSHSCIPVCEGIGRGLCGGNGVHGGCERRG